MKFEAQAILIDTPENQAKQLLLEAFQILSKYKPTIITETIQYTAIETEISNHLKNGDKKAIFNHLTLDNILNFSKLGYRITYLNDKWTVHLTD